MPDISKMLTRSRKEALLIFFGSIAFFLIYLYLRAGGDALMSVIPDGRLYISISDNFLATGHFTQTARIYRINMVAPFGLPLLLLPIRLITKSNAAIVAIQYILFGCSNVFACFAERNFFRTRGIVSLLITMLGAMYRYEVAPSVVACPEVWFMFFLYAALYVLSLDIRTPEKLSWLCALTFFAMAIRPFLAPFFIAAAAYTVYACAKRHISLRRTALCILIPCCVLLAFLLINHRESGVYVLFENYASIDLVAANNPSSSPTFFNILGFYKTVDPNKNGVDFAIASGEYRAVFNDYIAEYPAKFISDTLTKFYLMYVQHWFFLIVPVIASGILLMRRDKGRRLLFAFFLIAPVAMAFVASVGLYIHRYTIYVIPFWGLLLSGGIREAAAIYRSGECPALSRLRGVFSKG